MATAAASAALSRPLRTNLEQGLSQSILLLPVIELSILACYKFLFTSMDIYGIFLPITFLLTTEYTMHVSLKNHASLICSPCSLRDQLGHRTDLPKIL